nr:hypothetical protein [Tanacetum cinerariifolium]
MLVHQGEGSGTPTEPHHTPFPEADTTHPTTSSIPLPSIPTAPIPPVTQPDTTPIRQYSRRARIAQSSALPIVADEPASPVRDFSEWEACPTESGFIADQDRATIANLQRQYSELLAKFQAQEEEIVRLKDRVQVLEDREGVAAKQSRDDAPIKGRNINEGEAAAERISNDSEDVARVLTSMDAATVLAGGIDVPTGSGFIPTAGPPATIISTGSEVGPTASPIVGPIASPIIDAQVARELEEQQEKEDRRMNEQIARDAEVVRIHAEEEIQGMIDSLDRSNETIAKYLQEYQEFASELPLEKRIELISDQEAEEGILYGYDQKQLRMEAERLKRKGLNLEQEHVKKQKTSEEAPEMEKPTEEKMKELMQLVLVEDVYVQALQVKHPIIDWKQLDREDLNQLWALVKEYLSIRPTTKWKLYDLSRVHHLTAKDKEIFMLVEKDYPLRKGLALVMISYKLQVENYSQMAEDLLRKIYNIANTPRRIEMPLLGVCTASEEKKKKLPVKDRWQLH